MELELGYEFYSKVNDLEDSFLGTEIIPEVELQRIFYGFAPDDDLDGELVCIEESRTSEPLGYDYMEDRGSFFTKTEMNYEDIDYSTWSSFFEDYKMFVITELFDSSFEKIDEYISNSGVDIKTKSFTYQRLFVKIQDCRFELIEALSSTCFIDNMPLLNKYQQVLLSIHIDLYSVFLKRMKHEMYSTFLEGLMRRLPPEAKKEINEQTSIIEDTSFYKQLLEIDFITNIKTVHINFERIIATLGRSREFGGVVISNKKVYYSFCDRVGLIKKLEKEGFYSQVDIGAFLAKLAGFEDYEAAKTIGRYYGARFNKESKQYPFTKKTNLDLEVIFQKMQ